MPATVPAPRPRFVKLVLVALLALSSAPAVAQQLGSTFALDNQQTALVRVTPGQFVRVRLKDGARAGGPLIRATPAAFTVGPSVAFGDRDSVLALGNVDSLWVRAYSTRRGMLTGAVIGGLAGLGIGLTSTSLCPTEGSGAPKPCAQGIIATAASGALLGGVMGSLLGSGRTHWRRLLPQGDTPPAGLNVVATLTAPGDGVSYDPRAMALMRIPRESQVRLTFWNRGDLGGYLLRTGARGAQLGVVVGDPGGAPIPLETLEEIWERGDSRRDGSSIGLVLGALSGVVIATQSSACDPDKSCRTAIIADGAAFALFGYVAGGVVGSRFPKWHRRY
jgi:hypothetical protein